MQALAMKVIGITVGVIVGTAVLAAMFGFLRTGTWLLDSFGRESSLNLVTAQFQSQLNNLTNMQVTDDQKFRVEDQPSKRTAYYQAPLVGSAPSVCVANTWEFAPAVAPGLMNLVNTREVYSTDACTGTPQSNEVTRITGFTSTSKFLYRNASGRDLSFVRGQELGATASVNVRPAGLFDNEWLYPYPSLVTIDGALQQLLGADEDVAVSAATPLEQLRPGSEPWSPGALTAPTIAVSQVTGDTWTAQFTPTTSIDDNRAVLSWANQSIIGLNPQTGSLTSFSSADSLQSTITQGNRWQVQAAYMVTLGGESTVSATGTLDWVRPIDTPPAPSINVTETGATASGSACPTGTTAEYQVRVRIDNNAWGDWVVGNTTSATTSYTLNQGSRVIGQGSLRCYTIYTTSLFGQSNTATYIKPITTIPSVSVNSYLNGGTGYVDAAITSACPTGTSGQLITYAAYDYNTWGVLGGWTTGNARTAITGVGEGQRFRGAANARCISPYIQGPAGWAEDGTWDVRPITSTPWVSAGASISGGYGVAGRLAEGGCPGNTSYEWEYATRVNYGSWSAWSGWMPQSDNWVGTGRYVDYGNSFNALIHDRCVSAFTQGPAGGADTSGTVYRAYPAPSAPSGISMCYSRFIQSGGTQELVSGWWGAPTYANSYSYRFSWQNKPVGSSTMAQWIVGGWKDASSNARQSVGYAGGPGASVVGRSLDVIAKGPGGSSGVNTGTSAGSC